MDITAPLVERLVAAQFPEWAGEPVVPVEPGGWDNRTFRLGDDMLVRVPSAARYAAQVEKEQRWLPVLQPQLPLAIPTPIAMGEPAEGYPWRWSVYRWLEGTPATAQNVRDLDELARSLAAFLTALERIDPADGPPPGPHSFWRGGSLAVYDSETRQAIASLGATIDGAAATAAWEEALASSWTGPPVWVHGDIASGNLLVANGELRAVIDFGCCAVGDPACDLTIAWTLLSRTARRAFREAMPVNDASWTRARGWALWKALITLDGGVDPVAKAQARRTLGAVLGDHEDASGAW